MYDIDSTSENCFADADPNLCTKVLVYLAIRLLAAVRSCPVGSRTFRRKTFRRRTLRRRTVRRTDTSPYGHFAVRTFRREDTSP